MCIGSSVAHLQVDMHEQFPVVERLQYHLPNQQMVMFNDDDDV
jgi:hypothetical protein